MIELTHLDKFKHIETGEIVTFLCTDYSDNTKVIVLNEESGSGKVLNKMKFFREYYNITDEVTND